MAVTSEAMVLVSFIWLIFTSEILSDELKLPPIACPNYFRYEPRRRGYSGKIYLDDVPFKRLDLQVTFAQKQPIETGFGGRLAFEHDLITVQKDFEAGNPIIFNVDFPIATEIPKLIGIKMNGEDICVSSMSAEYQVTYSMRRSFTPSEGTHRIPKTLTSSTITTTEKSSLEIADSILCGLTPFNSLNVSHGQHDVIWGWFPWATKIYRRDIYNYRLSFIASGVLISSQTVLTGISSLYSNDTSEGLAVQLGVLGLIDLSSSYLKTVGVNSILRHPQYGKNSIYDADIALLHLDRPVSFNRYILPICLWNEVEETVNIVNETGYVGFVPLFGLDQVVNATVISQSQCLESDNFYSVAISSRTFCVKYNNGSGPAVDFNGGTAFVMNRNGRWTLRGMYAGCILLKNECATNSYFIYSDVAKFGTWIRENMLN